jgi:hypothetical protein
MAPAGAALDRPALWDEGRRDEVRSQLGRRKLLLLLYDAAPISGLGLLFMRFRNLSKEEVGQRNTRKEEKIGFNICRGCYQKERSSNLSIINR